jgi:uncharacterized membrane protein
MKVKVNPWMEAKVHSVDPSYILGRRVVKGGVPSWVVALSIIALILLISFVIYMIVKSIYMPSYNKKKKRSVKKMKK